MDLQDRVQQYILRHRMLEPGMGVLVGVSGGPDSVALLDVLYGLRAVLGISITVAHLNHRLRGAEAEADARYVRKLAEKFGLPCIVEECDVPTFRKAERLSIQTAARELRYEFFARAARETGARRVALGHHADDQAETILHHFLRGTGPAGLAGIAPVRGLFIRPLLGIRRREIEAYCRARGLDPRLDPSNLDPVYTRNRLRAELLPLLETEYNPNLVTALLRLGEICRAENDYMEEQTETIFRRSAAPTDGCVRLDADRVAALPPAIGRRMIRRAWSELAGDPGALDFDHVERVLELARAAAGGKRLDLPRGIRVERQFAALVFSLGPDPAEYGAWHYVLVVPGRTELPEVGLLITTDIRPAEQAWRPETLQPGQAAVDLDTLTLPLVVRNRRPGDVFWPQGAGGRMKLKEFLINNKVLRPERDRIPLVFDGEGRLVWVAGYRIAEFCKLTPGTRSVLLLTVSEPGPGVV
ncbi:tRNA lysidine(34) synthetase TilS [Candidatus Desulforudis audaxviator]|uniref:tRNA(Ile)-lysidine synthase n=1 Tax=Desulforudis audaxviator (strain MP104C) TaxID=477974 RepID=B1I1P2_DESAP|nr:tRNA lysidine(34) synthetase TilS [Candidatus Desulforudis audaxviator]ACA58654.1 tRNA(Ile)-lysidine synthetase [Candidatus Desulforudis audaxviator MP104C]AZK58654.1 tRNA(Ile)-lysidine synthetase [Candidatus Desulforudis audaxviator]